MTPETSSPVRADVVIVGSGTAGLSAALACAPLTVAIVTKTEGIGGGASPLARGGIAAAMGPGDSPESHAADTIAAAGGLADPDAVRELTTAGPRAIARLLARGAQFDRDPAGRLALGREAAHAMARIVHSGDETGAEVVRTLARAAAAARHVAVFPSEFAEDLIVTRGRVTGVRVLRRDGARRRFLARAVVLATGGIGRLFAATTNPPEARGDGLAMAARAGAALADLEFVQFHPTALDAAIDPRPLITEALRGAGAIFVDADGTRAALDDGSPAELAPRDVVSCWLERRRASGTRTFLDARGVGEARLRSGFHSVIAACAAAGLDPAKELIPVAPAAHYHMGGIVVDARGRASIPGLLACGEVSRTGVHGANRLASNSLLEALVFGEIVGKDLEAELGPPTSPVPIPDAVLDPAAAPCWLPDPDDEAVLRRAVSRGLGVFRDAVGLRRLLAALEELAPKAGAGELWNMVLVARLVATAALSRKESRGSHRRSDDPRAADVRIRPPMAS